MSRPAARAFTLRGMATFTTRFLGCKVSFADEQAIRERLLADGHLEADGRADVAVINTCCVTNEAVSKSRQAAAKAARTNTRVLVTGCAANLSERAFTGMPANVSVLARRSEEVAAAVSGAIGAIGCVQADHRLERVRAFVRIQDGCSFSCSFCVIPLVRGATRSRSAESVLAEIRRRARQGHREVVLTGVNLGCFRDRSAGMTLAGLIREAGTIEGLDRLRLSSIEVNHVNEDLIDAMRETPVVSRHLHVPLQSGDDRVLRDMGRRYTIGQYRARIEPLVDFNLTTDVIVGYPSEDEEAFANTVAAVEAIGITKVHVFPYSPRPGTRTEAADPVVQSVKKERSARLRAVSDAACRARWERRVGSTDIVLVDRPGLGYADDYTPWLVDAPVGDLVRARAVGVSEEGVTAVVTA